MSCLSILTASKGSMQLLDEDLISSLFHGVKTHLLYNVLAQHEERLAQLHGTNGKQNIAMCCLFSTSAITEQPNAPQLRQVQQGAAGLLK